MNRQRLPLILLAIGILLLLHQYVTWGYWWEPQDVVLAIHHETLALTSFAASGGTWLYARRLAY